jgi:hypothetical protein
VLGVPAKKCKRAGKARLRRAVAAVVKREVWRKEGERGSSSQARHYCRPAAVMSGPRL